MVSDAACDLIDRVRMWMPPWAIADHAEMPSRTHGRWTHTDRIYPSRLFYTMKKRDCACAELFSNGWSETTGKYAGSRHGGAFLLQPTVQ